MSTDDFGHNTGGLTLREIEDICIQSKTVTHETISNQKSIYLEEEFGDGYGGLLFFGSRTLGHANEDSDVDLRVVYGQYEPSGFVVFMLVISNL